MRKFFRITGWLTLSGILLLSGIIMGMYFYVKPELPSVEVLRDVKLQTPMKVYSSDGELISQFGQKRRIPLKIKDTPQKLIQAILATEDNRFYEHPGIDIVGIFRAAFVLATTGQKKQGASTLTMQVARNFFLTRDKTYIRKIKEIFIALHIESLLSKDEILELYLNKMELGHRAFGVGAAAQVYYGKSVDELTLAEIGVIAGLYKAPSTLNPIRSPERALERRNVVLGRMLTTGYITQDEYDIASNAPNTGKFHGAEITLNAPFIAEMVRKQMVEQYGEEGAYTTGFRVYTTVSAKTQKAAQDAVIDNMHRYDERHGYRGPIKTLWAETDEPLDLEQIQTALAKQRSYRDLEPAAVIDVEAKQIMLANKDGNIIAIDQAGFEWAREFINDSKQGPAPKDAREFLQPGQMVWIKPHPQHGWQLSQLPDVSSAIVSLDPENGAIRALVGGYHFRLSEYDRATQARRQVGSNIKPFIYSAALENGYTLGSIVNDAPINKSIRSQGVTWRPKNSPPVYDGPIRVRKALALSKNVVSVRLLRGIGLDNAITHLARFGFDPNELPRNESLALGSASLTPLEVASGFATFANGGYQIQPHIIDRVEDAYGNVVWRPDTYIVCEICEQYYAGNLALDDENLTLPEVIPPSEQLAPRILSKQNAFLIADALESAIWGGGSWRHKTGWNGTGWRAQALKRRDLSGKTGTTNESKDAWFSGFSRHLVTTVWIGFDDHSRELGRALWHETQNKTMFSGAEAGATSALPAWVDYMKVALEDYEVDDIPVPEGIVTVRIDEESGKLAIHSDYTSRFEYFVTGTEPKETVSAETNIDVLNQEEDELLPEEEIF